MTQRNVEYMDYIVSLNIKKYRTMLGISQKQIAKVLGVTIQQVQKYERSKNRISSGKLHAIAILFGMPITSFFSLNQAYLEN